MNFDFIYSQMVGILHCNICLINDKGDIEKIYGDISEKQNPLLTDEAFASNFCNGRDWTILIFFMSRTAFFMPLFL